jgi:molybdenum cofactor cytidylyltransferase
MGQPKLLMPWEATTVIQHVVSTWRASRVHAVVIVVRADDKPLLSLLSTIDVHVVTPPTAPPEMKHSVQCGLEYVQQQFTPDASDRWLLSPADTPTISIAHINAALASSQEDAKSGIVIPVYNGRRGHPVVFPWTMAKEVFELGDHEGVNAIVHRHEVKECPISDNGILEDLDTPEQYRRLRGTS